MASAARAVSAIVRDSEVNGNLLTYHTSRDGASEKAAARLDLAAAGITEWLPGWIAKGWRKGDKKPVENRDLWERLIGQTEGLAVDWCWVRGHDGNEWNERADQLATAASAEAKRNGVTGQAT